MIKVILSLLFLCASLFAADQGKEIAFVCFDKNDNAEYRITVSREVAQQFPYIKGEKHIYNQPVYIFQNGYTAESLKLLFRIAEVIYINNPDKPDTIVQGIDFYTKSQLIPEIKKATPQDMLLCIKACNILVSPAYTDIHALNPTLQFLVHEFTNKLKKAATDEAGEDINFGNIQIIDENKYFAFLKKEIIDVLSTYNVGSFFGRYNTQEMIHLLGTADKKLIKESWVPKGNLYAYMLETKENQREVYTVNLTAEKPLSQLSFPGHTGPIGSYNYQDDLYPAYDVDTIASTAFLDNNVLFHRLAKTETLSIESVPDDASETRYALSADGKFLLVLFYCRNSDENNRLIFRKYDLEKHAFEDMHEKSIQGEVKLKNCFFNPQAPDVFAYSTEQEHCIIYSKYDDTSKKREYVEQVFARSNETILVSQFSEDGSCMYVVTLNRSTRKMYVYKFHYLSPEKKVEHAVVKNISSAHVIPSHDNNQCFIELQYIDNMQLPSRRYGLLKVDFDSKTPLVTSIQSNQGENFDAVAYANLIVYKTKGWIHFYDTFFKKENSKHSIDGCNAILGFSSKDLLWLRMAPLAKSYTQYITAYHIRTKEFKDIEPSIEKDLTTDFFATYINLLSTKPEHRQAWYDEFIKNVPTWIREKIQNVGMKNDKPMSAGISSTAFTTAKEGSESAFSKETIALKQILEKKKKAITEEAEQRRMQNKQGREEREKRDRLLEQGRGPTPPAYLVQQASAPQPTPPTIFQRIASTITTMFTKTVNVITAPFRWVLGIFGLA